MTFPYIQYDQLGIFQFTSLWKPVFTQDLIQEAKVMSKY